VNSIIFLDFFKISFEIFLVDITGNNILIDEIGNWEFDTSIQLRAAFGSDVP
jgi:hypothetical protein